MTINVLCIGDVVGRPGRKVLAACLGKVIADKKVDFVACNAENAAGGSGLTVAVYQKLLSYGVDAITLGDHAYRKREIFATLQSSDRIVRPANLSAQAIGRRWTVLPAKSSSCRVAVACILGQMYMGQHDSPWGAIDNVLAEIPAEVKVRIVDFHAEASSEKIAIGYHLDGRASVVFGTHTHIPTADARILEGGTACISDVGMTGPYDSVLGRRKDRVLSAMTTSMPSHFEIATGDVRLCGALVAVDAASGKAVAIERVEVQGPNCEGGPYDRDDGLPQHGGNQH